MFHLKGCRASSRGWTQNIARTVLASAFLVGVVPAINAQPSLQITQAYSGNFNNFGTGNGCSSVSPQFVNLPAIPTPAPVAGTPQAAIYFTVPSGCTNRIQLWVANTGISPTDGTPITVTISLGQGGQRSITLLSANGYTAAPGNIAVGTANGWTCTIPVRETVSCTSSAVIAAGKSSTAITLSVLIESIFAAPPNLNLASSVAGGGAGTGLGAFDIIQLNPDSVPGQGGIKPLSVNGTRLTVHTSPEGLGMNVDGVIDPTPHFFFYTVDTVHTFMEPFPATFVVSQGLTGTSGNSFVDPFTQPPYVELITLPNVDTTSATGSLIYTYVVAIR